jgi:hypothetical protein
MSGPKQAYAFDEVREILQEFGFTAHIRPLGEEANTIKWEARACAALGWRADTFVDELLSPAAHSVRQEARELAFRFSILLVA